jgi:hypothetical protein
MTVVLDYVSVMLEIVSTRLTEDVKLFSRGSRAQFEDIIAAANKHQTHAPERLVTPLHAPGDQTGLPRDLLLLSSMGMWIGDWPYNRSFQN